MEKGVILRFYLLVMTFIIIFSVSLFVFPTFDVKKHLYEYIQSGNFFHLLSEIPGHLFTALAITFIAFNYHAVLSFIRRRIKATDEQVVGIWYVSRYLKKNNELYVETDEWHITRDLSGKYRLTVISHNSTYRNNTGVVIYNERDRFTIILSGSTHKEQSFVMFYPNIPKDMDSRMVGLGLGDDHQYVMSCRVYMASRVRIDDTIIKSVLDGVTETLKNTVVNGSLVQLLLQDVWPVLGSYPITSDSIITQPHEPSVSLWRRLCIIAKRWRPWRSYQSTRTHQHGLE